MLKIVDFFTALVRCKFDFHFLYLFCLCFCVGRLAALFLVPPAYLLLAFNVCIMF